MKGNLVVLLTVVCTLNTAELESEMNISKSLRATENLVQELLQEVISLKSQDKLRDKKVAHLEKQLRLQRQRNTHLDIMLKKLTLHDGEQALIPVEKAFVLTPEISRDALNNRLRRQEVEGPIAFFAKMENHLEHGGVHQNVVFDVTVTNLGNAYNNHFGVFVAPVAGTYVFSTTLVSRHFAAAHAQFVLNGNDITNMYVAGGSSGTGDDTTSQTIVLQLKKGDDVAVQNMDPDRGFYGVSHSTFSGFMLQEDFSDSAIIGKK